MRRLFRRTSYDDPARTLFERIASQSREPSFYGACGLPDSVDGRFDLLVLHVFLVMHQLKQDHVRTAELSQALFDVLFENMDESLRVLGAGDMGVGRRIKDMAEGFYGRVLAYEQALEEGGGSLENCVRRNLYGSADASQVQVASVAHYVRREADSLAGQSTDRLMEGDLAFGPAPAPDCGAESQGGAGGARR